jgi:hypothetical protein
VRRDVEQLLPREHGQLLPHRGTGLGVETRRRLVEEEHLGAVHEPEAHVEPALHAARVAAHDPVGGLGDAEEVEQVLDAVSQPRARHPLHAALQHQVLAARGIPIDARALRHVADRAANRIRVAHDVVPGDLGAPAVGRGQRGQYLDGCRLAGSVGAQQPEDLATPDAERDTVERLHLSVSLLEPLRDDRVHPAESRVGRQVQARVGAPTATNIGGRSVVVLRRDRHCRDHDHADERDEQHREGHEQSPSAPTSGLEPGVPGHRDPNRGKPRAPSELGVRVAGRREPSAQPGAR